MRMNASVASASPGRNPPPSRWRGISSCSSGPPVARFAPVDLRLLPGLCTGRYTKVSLYHLGSLSSRISCFEIDRGDILFAATQTHFSW